MERVTIQTHQTVAPPVVQALAEGFRAAGVCLATNHPGFHSHSLAAAIHDGRMITSSNERNAYAVAWGAAVGGCRTVVATKNVGLNDAADLFLSSMMLDLSAALVVAVFDDTDVEQSHMRQDSRHYHGFLGGLWLEPAGVDEAFAMAAQAVELSERFSSPVVVRITNRLAAVADPFRPCMPPQGGMPSGKRPFERRQQALVVHPSNYHSKQSTTLAAKRQGWQEWAEQELSARAAPLVPDATGAVHLVVGSAAPPCGVAQRSLLHLPMLPVPTRQILAKAAGARRIVVHEHGDPIVAVALAAARAVAPEIEPVTSGVSEPNRNFHNRATLAPLFAALRNLPDPILVGDVGGHTMDPAYSLDVCLCYGSAVGVATGLALARPRNNVVCVIGDGAWLHGGKAALPEAIARGIRLLIVVLHNGGCRTVGGLRPVGETPACLPQILETLPEIPLASSLRWEKEVAMHASFHGIHILHLTVPD